MRADAIYTTGALLRNFTAHEEVIMIRSPLVFAAVSDFAGKTRGKAFPEQDLNMRLRRGVGWAPTCVQITCFDTIAPSPFGAIGEVLMMPQKETEVRVNFQDGTSPEHFFLCDITTLDGKPWGCCTRGILKAALERLYALSGVRLCGAFEHEFQIKDKALTANDAYGINAFSLRRQLGEAIMAALAQAGLQPDSFMKEYGTEQYEFTVKPKHGVAVADAAVIARELARMTARRFGEEATFCPIQDIASVGNGVHVHMSFQDEVGNSVSYDPEGPYGMSKLTGAFAAGVLKYLDAILALTAPSAVSYQRLTPHRWSVAYNNIGFEDREAALRISPVTDKSLESVAQQFNLEYRAADAAASPYLVLAAIVHAGTQGIEEKLPVPPVSHEDLSLLSEAELTERGYVRNPQSLEEALERMNNNKIVCSWFPEEFIPVYTAHKKCELEQLKEECVEKQCALYAQTY